MLQVVLFVLLVFAVVVGVVFGIVCWFLVAILWIVLLVLRVNSLFHNLRMNAVGCEVYWISLVVCCFCLVFLVCFCGIFEVLFVGGFGIVLSALTCFQVAMISLIVFLGVPGAISVCFSCLSFKLVSLSPVCSSLSSLLCLFLKLAMLLSILFKSFPSVSCLGESSRIIPMSCS